MYMGIDVGSRSTNAVIIDNQGKMVGYSIIPSGYNQKDTVREVIKEVLQTSDVKREEIVKIIGTGYGRRNISDADRTVTEITCHALGAHQFFPDAQMIIDIGGQDSKVIYTPANGVVEEFVMNDKCSAGTGRFLEVMASVLNMSIEEFSEAGLKAEESYKISSTCTVFAESEVISGITNGIARESIVAGICQSIVNRIQGLAGRINCQGTIILTGGVAKNKSVVFFMRKKWPDILVPSEPQIIGALGAGMIAYYES